MTHAHAPTSGESAALSRDLADFLIELSIALHKNAIYPSGHPLLSGAVDLGLFFFPKYRVFRIAHHSPLASPASSSSSRVWSPRPATRCCVISPSGCTVTISAR